MRFLILALLGFAVPPAALHAQTNTPRLHSDGMMGLHVGTPALLSLAVGGYREYWRQDSTAHSTTRFLFLLVEPGIIASRLSIGRGEGSSSDLPIMGTYRITALRVTTGDVANYIGLESTMTLFGLTARGGIFGRRGGAGPPVIRLGLDVGIFM